MSPSPLDPLVRRAARLSRIPGVTLAEACDSFGVKRSAVQRARRGHGAEINLTIEELAVSALTNKGLTTSGTTSGLEQIAGWIDYINHDACTAEEVRAMLESEAKRGVLELEGGNWRLLQPFP